MKHIDLGDKVKDRITGCIGIVIARTEYLAGNVQCNVQPIMAKDDVPQSDFWVGEYRLEVIESKAILGGPKEVGPIGFGLKDSNNEICR
jgi:hypothetical protein